VRVQESAFKRVHAQAFGDHWILEHVLVVIQRDKVAPNHSRVGTDDRGNKREAEVNCDSPFAPSRSAATFGDLLGLE
jgi:hypothetical protein